MIEQMNQRIEQTFKAIEGLSIIESLGLLDLVASTIKHNARVRAQTATQQINPPAPVNSMDVV